MSTLRPTDRPPRLSFLDSFDLEQALEMNDPDIYAKLINGAQNVDDLRVLSDQLGAYEASNTRASRIRLAIIGIIQYIDDRHNGELNDKTRSEILRHFSGLSGSRKRTQAAIIIPRFDEPGSPFFADGSLEIEPVDSDEPGSVAPVPPDDSPTIEAVPVISVGVQRSVTETTPETFLVEGGHASTNGISGSGVHLRSRVLTLGGLPAQGQHLLESADFSSQLDAVIVQMNKYTQLKQIIAELIKMKDDELKRHKVYVIQQNDVLCEDLLSFIETLRAEILKHLDFSDALKDDDHHLFQILWKFGVKRIAMNVGDPLRKNELKILVQELDQKKESLKENFNEAEVLDTKAFFRRVEVFVDFLSRRVSEGTDNDKIQLFYNVKKAWEAKHFPRKHLVARGRFDKPSF